MELDGRVLATIAGMALVTYATRAGGFWLMRRIPLSRRTQAFLRNLPGAVLMSLVAPAILTGGTAGALGASATAAVMLATGRELLAMAAGVATVAAVRGFLV